MLVESEVLLSTAAINVLVEHAVAKAEALGVAVNIAIMDASAQMCGFLRMQGAHIGSIDVALDKAWTSVAFGGKSTAELAAWIEGLPDSMRHSCLMRPRFTPMGGALPIWIEGELVGSIGVSGASAEEDELCAEAAISALKSAISAQRS